MDRKFFVPKVCVCMCVPLFMCVFLLNSLEDDLADHRVFLYAYNPHFVCLLVVALCCAVLVQGAIRMAHMDEPIKEGNIHISAPHIYGVVVEALELPSNSSMTFLNAGSGTGYLTCIAASIMGPSSSHYCKQIGNSQQGRDYETFVVLSPTKVAPL